MPRILKYRLTRWALGVCAFSLPIGTISAQSLDSSVEAEKQINEESSMSQSRVSSLAQQAQDLLNEYRSVVRETESLKIYNDNLETVVSDQRN
jgi:hypothetical protein